MSYESFLDKVEPKLNSFEEWGMYNWIPVFSLIVGPTRVVAGTTQSIAGAVTGTFFRLQYQVNRKNTQALLRSRYSFAHVRHGIQSSTAAVFTTLFSNLPPFCFISIFGMAMGRDRPYPFNDSLKSARKYDPSCIRP